jgi:O-antigen/teichoic acid export membrane protein
VTPDPALNTIEEPKLQPPSTAGMTTKVVKGSMWTLGGSVLPLAVSFISTPFIIRFLGTESYGVLLLVGLIPTYFSFADFGMGIASTKFASEAFGQGDSEKERQIVWTAAAVAAVSAMIVAVPIFLFSRPIVTALNVPEHLIAQASVALKITSAAFVLGIVVSVMNSPMLARLRMDLNTVTNAVPKILLAAVTPFILYFGGGIVGAVTWAFIVSVIVLAVVFYFSGRLLPSLLRPAFRREHLTPLLKFGGAWVVAMIAAMLLVNLEKIFLTKLVSVQALAYYSVAFTFANMAAMFSQAMTQSLYPAFSQLMAPEKRAEFDALFARGIRLNITCLLPTLVVMFVIAEPFFTLWAGEEFGRESTLPFYVLLAGLFFNILAFIPHASITATGRTDLFARLYWIELLIYAGLAWVLIGYFGIIGAAAAWSIRVFLDAFVVIHLSKKIAHTKFGMFRQFGALCVAIASLAPPVLLVLLLGSKPAYLLSLTFVSVLIYGVIAWKKLFLDDEKAWAREKMFGLLR